MRKNMKYQYTPKLHRAAEWLLSRKNLVGYAIVVAMRVIRLKELVRTDQKNVSVSAMNKKQIRARQTMMETLAKREGYFESSYERQKKVQDKLKANDPRKRVV
jgi:hypothetical protein